VNNRLGSREGTEDNSRKEILDKDNSDEIIKNWNFGEDVEKMVFAAYIKAKKPQSRNT